jgi:prepilin-type N-terminal cleavage/methylation domain-containing protein
MRTTHRHSAARGDRRRRHGFSMVELMIASAITAMITAVIMAAVMAVLRTEANALIEEGMLSHARHVENRLQRIIRPASRDVGVGYQQEYSDADGIDFYHRILFRRNTDSPVESLTFADGDLIYDPNRNAAGDEEVIAGPNARVPGAAYVRLEDVGFRFAQKDDGSDDGNMVTMQLQMTSSRPVRREGGSAGVVRMDRSIAVQVRGK